MWRARCRAFWVSPGIPGIDRALVQDWLADIFEADRESGQLLRVFIQANVADSGFSEAAQTLLGTIIEELGKHIPAFALDPQADRKRWLEAWLLIYEILDQSNHAARGAGVSTDPMVIEILADRFLQFVDSVRMIISNSLNIASIDICFRHLWRRSFDPEIPKESI